MTTFMLGCTALEKTRCKKHGQAILFFIGISLMAVPFLYEISIFQDVCKTKLYPFLRNAYAIIVQSKNLREVSIFICRSDFLSSTRSFLLASTVIVQVQRYGSGLWKYSATFVSSVKKHIQCF